MASNCVCVGVGVRVFMFIPDVPTLCVLGFKNKYKKSGSSTIQGVCASVKKNRLESYAPNRGGKIEKNEK